MHPFWTHERWNIFVGSFLAYVIVQKIIFQNPYQLFVVQNKNSTSAFTFKDRIPAQQQYCSIIMSRKMNDVNGMDLMKGKLLKGK